MFTMKICDSDAFLDMPLSSQCLYFHLCMRADDDGFLGNPKRIKNMIGASDDDLKLLIAKRFLLVFEDGVIVIKHWKMHNTIQKDRYTPTPYQDELSQLFLKSNKSYSLTSGNAMETKCIQNVSPDIDIGLDIDSDKDIEKEKEKKLARHKYGEFNNVLLSDEDLEKLKSKYPSSYESYIESLSGYIAKTGKRYKSHYATILTWIRKDEEKNNGKEDGYASTRKRAAERADEKWGKFGQYF